MSMMVSFVLSFFPRDVLDEILNLIESVSEDFPSYSYKYCMFYVLCEFLVFVTLIFSSYVLNWVCLLPKISFLSTPSLRSFRCLVWVVLCVCDQISISKS